MKKNDCVKAILTVSMVVLASITGIAVISDTSMDSEAETSETLYVKFVTAASGSNGDGTKGNPIEIVAGTNNTQTNLPESINENDNLIVLHVEDIANIAPLDETKVGKYYLDKSVNLIADSSIKGTVWNASIMITNNNVNVSFEGFLFGEIFTAANDNATNVNVTYNECNFLINSQSVNYTSNSNTDKETQEKYKTEVINVRGGGNINLNISKSNFNCTEKPSFGEDRIYAIYPKTTGDLIINECNFDGYNSGIWCGDSSSVEVTNNVFSNVTARSDTEFGFAMMLSETKNKEVVISNNTATAKSGNEVSFLRVHESYSPTLTDDTVKMDDNSMIGFKWGVNYKSSTNTSSNIGIVATGNLFSEDGQTATEMKIESGSNSTSPVTQEDVVMEIPSTEPEEPSTPSIPDDDDELPFIPPQSDDGDGADTTTYVAVAAAAAVVAILAVLAVGISKGKL